MIKRGDNPDGDPKHNKFLAKGGDGHRGVLVAVTPNGKEAIVRAVTSDGDEIRLGRLYRVRETSPRKFPKVVGSVKAVPAKGWVPVKPYRAPKKRSKGVLGGWRPTTTQVAVAGVATALTVGLILRRRAA